LYSVLGLKFGPVSRPALAEENFFGQLEVVVGEILEAKGYKLAPIVALCLISDTQLIGG